MNSEHEEELKRRNPSNFFERQKVEFPLWFRKKVRYALLINKEKIALRLKF